MFQLVSLCGLKMSLLRRRTTCCKASYIIAPLWCHLLHDKNVAVPANSLLQSFSWWGLLTGALWAFMCVFRVASYEMAGLCTGCATPDITAVITAWLCEYALNSEVFGCGRLAAVGLVLLFLCLAHIYVLEAQGHQRHQLLEQLWVLNGALNPAGPNSAAAEQRPLTGAPVERLQTRHWYRATGSFSVLFSSNAAAAGAASSQQQQLLSQPLLQHRQQREQQQGQHSQSAVLGDQVGWTDDDLYRNQERMVNNEALVANQSGLGEGGDSVAASPLCSWANSDKGKHKHRIIVTWLACGVVSGLCTGGCDEAEPSTYMVPLSPSPVTQV